MKDGIKERGFFWHWQNLRKEDATKHLLNGRAWIHHRPRGVFGIQWVLPTRQVHLDLTISGPEDQMRFSLAVGLFALYFHFAGWPWLQTIVDKLCPDYHERQIGLSWFMWSLSWHIWADPMEWHSSTPKWRDGSFNLPDFLFGRYLYSKVDQEPIPVTIPMSEGEYQGKIVFFQQTWRRRRFPYIKRSNGAEVEIEGGIPIPGKGENSWDCDDDAYLSIGLSATTVEEAIAAVIHKVNTRRERYGGKNWLPVKAVT